MLHYNSISEHPESYNEGSMDARPTLFTLARVLHEHGLEAVLIGNAAAALHGAPVTTVDFDFLFRKTPSNLRKLKAVARSLGATVLRPYYPVSDLFRLMRDQDLLQVDFMGRAGSGSSSSCVLSQADTSRIMDGTVESCRPGSKPARSETYR
jgi:hypothetical protein